MEQKQIDAQTKHELPLAFFALIYSLFLIFVMINSFVAYVREFGGEFWVYFCMFTYQTNFLVLAWLLSFSITRFRGKHTRFAMFITNRHVMTGLTVYISLTFFIVALVLEPVYASQFNPINSGFFTHNLTPVVMWLYFFLVPGHGTIKYRNIPYLMIYPALYLLTSIIVGMTVTLSLGVGANQSAYAYGFIDYTSYPHISLYVLSLVGIGIALAGFCWLLMRFKKFLVKHYYEYED